MVQMKRKSNNMVIKKGTPDLDRCKGETMDLAISFQEGFEHHEKSVISPPSFHRIHGCHDLHPYPLRQRVISNQGKQISFMQIEFEPKISLSVSFFFSFSLKEVINMQSGLSS